MNLPTIILPPGENQLLCDSIVQHTGHCPVARPRVFADTTEFMDIRRDDVISLDRKNFLVTGNAFEGRFGIDDHPKFWVKHAVDLDDGSHKILKLVFNESIPNKIGPFTFQSIRSPEKEARALEITQGDERFMQGYTMLDTKHNRVRIIDRIKGVNLYDHILSLNMAHEEYFHTLFPVFFRKIVSCAEAIGFLHGKAICHGDIRTDHVFVEAETERFRWIDFDFKQYMLDFDVWSMGNVLMFVAGMGEVSLHQLARGAYGNPDLFDIRRGDTSAFLKQRIANLKKIYPYIPGALNDILMKYSFESEEQFQHYKSMEQLLEDLRHVSLN